jgi:IclR family transcriptional regulator, acetate operon repressor
VSGAEQTAGETVNLIGVRGSRLVYEAVLEGRYSLRSLPSLGMTVAAHCSALGKAVLAAAPAPLREVLPGPSRSSSSPRRPSPPGTN